MRVRGRSPERAGASSENGGIPDCAGTRTRSDLKIIPRTRTAGKESAKCFLAKAPSHQSRRTIGGWRMKAPRGRELSLRSAENQEGGGWSIHTYLPLERSVLQRRLIKPLHNAYLYRRLCIYMLDRRPSGRLGSQLRPGESFVYKVARGDRRNVVCFDEGGTWGSLLITPPRSFDRSLGKPIRPESGECGPLFGIVANIYRISL